MTVKEKVINISQQKGTLQGPERHLSNVFTLLVILILQHHIARASGKFRLFKLSFERVFRQNQPK